MDAAEVKAYFESLTPEQESYLRQRRQRTLDARYRPQDVPDLVANAKRNAATLGHAVVAASAGDLAANLFDTPAFLTSSGQLEMYWVSSEMTDLLVDAANQIPDAAIPQDVVSQPIRHGFVWFEKPILSSFSHDPGLGPVPICGFAWVVTLWARSDEPPRLCIAQMALGMILNRVVPYDSLVLLPGTPLNAQGEASQSDDDNLLSADEDRRLLLALMGLLTTSIVETKAATIPRAVARRSARESLPDTVRVIRLRHRTGDGSHGGSDPVGWSHRWLVSGHWRNQAVGRDRTGRRLTWIAAHIKGPDDKPLVLRPTVKALVR